MFINITNTVRISVEQPNISIERRVTSEKKGTTRWEQVAHYGTLSSACQGLLDRHFHLLAGLNEEMGVRQLVQVLSDAKTAVVMAAGGKSAV